MAEVKLEAFPFTKYGVIEGIVEDVSNDAVNDENLGLVYQARIKLDRQTNIARAGDGAYRQHGRDSGNKYRQAPHY